MILNAISNISCKNLKENKNSHNYEEKSIYKTINMNSSYNEKLNVHKNIQLLKHLKHDNILFLKSAIKNKNDTVLEFEKVTKTLSDLLNIQPELFTQQFIKKIFYQIVLGTTFIHFNKVEHFNLDLENIYVNENLKIKISGFDKALPINFSNNTSPVRIKQSFYCAPEIILNNQKNNDSRFKSDIWRLGCIFYALLNKNDTLNVKKHYLKILNLTIQLLGTPNNTDIAFITNNAAKKWILNQKIYHGKKPSMYLQQPYIDQQAKNLLDTMLVFNPQKRLSCKEIINHPYFADIHDSKNLKFTEKYIKRDLFKNILINKKQTIDDSLDIAVKNFKN